MLHLKIKSLYAINYKFRQVLYMLPNYTLKTNADDTTHFAVNNTLIGGFRHIKETKFTSPAPHAFILTRFSKS